MDRQGRRTADELLRVRWDGVVTTAVAPAPTWFGLHLQDGEARLDPATVRDPAWRVLATRIMGRAAARCPGPVGLTAGDAGPDFLDLVVGSSGWGVRRRAAGPDPGHFDLVGRLRDGASGLLRHEFRSPLVRLQGAVTLAGRTARRQGAVAAIMDELAGAERALGAQLELADTAVAAITGLLAGAPTEELTGAGFLAAVARRRQAPTAAVDGGWAPVTDVAGGLARNLTVVIPRPSAGGVGALARLLDHAAAAWPSQAGRLVLPGESSSWPATTQPGAATGVTPGPDAEFDLRLVRRWGPSGSALLALQDVRALQSMGAVVSFDAGHDAGPWRTLRLRPDGVAEVIGPVSAAGALAPLLRSLTPVGVVGEKA